MVSQPFLTKIMNQLEAELGVELFEHVGRKIKLNDFGTAFYKRTKNILHELENALTEIKEMADQQSHTVSTVTNVGLYMPHILAKNNNHKRDKSSKIHELMSKVAAQYPNLPGWRPFLEAIHTAKRR